jgi:hypothetical protein
MAILHEDVFICVKIPRFILLKRRNVGIKVTDKRKIHILCSITFLPKIFVACDIR